jgi:outer membrane lipoprotein-sorting protein
MPLGPLGALEVTNLYKYVGKAKLNDKEYDKISFTSEVAYSLPKEDAGIAFRVVKGALKVDPNAKGAIYFDSANGRLVQYEMSLNLTGELTLSINNVPLDTKITKQEQTVKVTVSTDNPITKPK